MFKTRVRSIYFLNPMPKAKRENCASKKWVLDQVALKTYHSVPPPKNSITQEFCKYTKSSNFYEDIKTLNL